MIGITRGPKPKCLLSIETPAALLIGEKIAGRWVFECDQFPWLTKQFEGARKCIGCVKEFLRLSNEEVYGH